MRTLTASQQARPARTTGGPYHVGPIARRLVLDLVARAERPLPPSAQALADSLRRPGRQKGGRR